MQYQNNFLCIFVNPNFFLSRLFSFILSYQNWCKTTIDKSFSGWYNIYTIKAVTKTVGKLTLQRAGGRCEPVLRIPF